MPDPPPGEELAQRLRDLRGERRQVDVADQSGISQPQIARFERGRQVPRPDQVEALCRVYGAPEREIRRLAEIAQQIREGNARVVMTRDFAHAQREIGRLQREAKVIRGFSPSGIPGLLQSGDYVRALFTTGGTITPEDEAGAAERLANQRIIADETSGRAIIMIMPEGSLGWALMPPDQMAAQIEHIAEVSRRPNMRVGVIPWGRPSPTIPLHSWEMYEGGSDGPVVVAGSTIGANFLTSPADVAKFADLFDELERLAAFDDTARAILARIAERYRDLSH